MPRLRVRLVMDLTPQQHAALKKAAWMLQTSMTSLVITAVQEYVGRHLPGKTELLESFGGDDGGGKDNI